MDIISKGLQAAKSLLRRQLLKRAERKLLAEIRIVSAELASYPEHRVYYLGEYLPNLELQLAEVRAKLHNTAAPRTALGNVHGSASSPRMRPPPLPTLTHVMSVAPTTRPGSPSATSGGSRSASASAAPKPSADLKRSASPTPAQHAS